MRKEQGLHWVRGPGFNYHPSQPTFSAIWVVASTQLCTDLVFQLTKQIIHCQYQACWWYGEARCCWTNSRVDFRRFYKRYTLSFLYRRRINSLLSDSEWNISLFSIEEARPLSWRFPYCFWRGVAEECFDDNTSPTHFNSLRPRPNRRHFADDIFKCIFENENEWITPRISLKFVPKVRINNISALVQIMAWRRPDDKLLSEPMMVSLPTHICVTRPQWVKKKNRIKWTPVHCRCSMRF